MAHDALCPRTLGIMSRALVRMQAVLDDMLTYEKLQHGQLQFSQARFNLQGSVTDVIHQFSHVAAQNNVELCARAAPFGQALFAYSQSLGDRTRLVQVLSNFTSNALKFVSSGDRVVIEYAAFLRRPKGCHSRWSHDMRPLGGALSAQPACQSAIALAMDTDPELFATSAGQQSHEMGAEAEGANPRNFGSPVLLTPIPLPVVGFSEVLAPQQDWEQAGQRCSGVRGIPGRGLCSGARCREREPTRPAVCARAGRGHWY